MVHFIIAGMPNCTFFEHAIYVAEYLQKSLPNFTFTRMEVIADDWEYWLGKLNRKYDWHASTSPVIYKHLLGFGKKAHLIGGLSDFWEYCYDYYGLESTLTTQELEDLLKDNLTFRSKDDTEKKEKTNIMIYGYDEILELLVPQLLDLPSIQGPKGISFIFYAESPTVFKALVELLLTDYNVSAVATDDLNTGIDDCDLLLITYDFTINSRRVLVEMKYLSETLNLMAKRYIKILFACSGLSCYAATVLVSNSQIIQNNVAVVTSELALPSLRLVAQSCNLSLEDFCGPPVWGFIGINEFIDIGNCLKKCNLVIPFHRAIKSTSGTTLVQGKLATEFRYIKYMSDDIPNFSKTLEGSKTKLNSLDRQPTYARVYATVNILDLWFSKDSDKVVSAGIVSDGSFGIPAGIVFSQPACLVNGTWQPFPEYPVTNKLMDKLMDLIEDTRQFLKSCNRKLRFEDCSHETL